MPEKLETRVPPWVQIFADLNPENVEIIEMTNPIITEMAPVDQPIEERLHESVFLLRNGLTPAMVKRLENIVDKTFPAIQNQSTRLHRATQVGKQSYHAWQSVRYQNCNCFYPYEGTARHTLYHYTPVQEHVVDNQEQPAVVTQLLEELWSSKGILAPQENKFPHAQKHCPMNALIVNKYENGDTIGAHSDNVSLSSRGQADDLHSSNVVTISLHVT